MDSFRRRRRLPAIALVIACVTCFAAVFVSWAANGREALIVERSTPQIAFARQLEVLDDETAMLSIDDVESVDWADRFVPTDTTDLSYGYSSSAYWLRFALHNPETEARELLLDVRYPQLDHVDLYSRSGDGTHAVQKMGDSLPYEARELKFRTFVFPIMLSAGASEVFHLRVQSSSVVSIPVRLSSADSYAAWIHDETIVTGAFYGILLGLLAYNLFFLVSTRESAFLYYCGAAAGYICYFGQLDGFGYRLWSNPGFWQSHSIFAFGWIGGLCVLQFGRQFLDLREAMPGMDRILRVLLGAMLVSPIAWFVLSLEQLGALGVTYASAGMLLPVAAFMRWRAGFSPAGFYLIAWVPFWFSLAASGAASFNAFPDFLTVVVAFKFAVIAERGMMSFALASRLKVLQTRQLTLAEDNLVVRGEALAESERRRIIEAELHEREAELLQAKKMEAVGRLAGGVAHDFNNLLTVIQGYSELLAEEESLDEDSRDMAEQMRYAADQAGILTRRLLSLSRADRGSEKRLNINTAITRLKPTLVRLMGDSIAVDLDLDPWIGHIQSDPGRLEQVVVNLTVNSRDAMRDGGRIAIATDEVEVGEPTRDGDLPPGRYVRLRVSDTGCGMDAETQERLFEPFFTTKELGKGTGLGLSIVYGIVTQADGRIRVDSGLDRGTCVEVLLPSHDPSETEVDPNELEGTELRGGSEGVLLVEDATNVLALMQARLESLGYRVFVAMGGPEALEILEKHAPKISLLVTDVVMPDMTGPALSEKVSALYPDIGVIFLSGFPQRPGEPSSMVPSDAFFLPKPVSLRELADAIRKVLDAHP